MNKEGWPEFPLPWLEVSERNMESLSVLASHLHDKTKPARQGRSGFIGSTSNMEQQIIANLTSLEQSVYVLTDVVLSSLQIIGADYHRRTRVKRAWRWVAANWKKLWMGIDQNPLYRVIAIIATIVAVLTFLFRHFHVFSH